MADWGASGRRDTYSFDLVDPFTLAKAGTLDAEPSACSLTWAYDSDNIVSGKVTEVNSDFRLGGRDMLVRINHHCECDGEVVDEPLATMFVDNLSRSSHDGMTKRALTLYSTRWRLSQDFLPSDFARAKGTGVIDAIKNLVNTAGGRFSIAHDAPTARTFGANIGFPVGSNRLEAIETMAGWISCETGVDPRGWITIAPYVDPAKRSVAYTFADGSNCTYKAGIEWDSTRSDPINRVVAYFTREKKPADEAANIPLSARCVVDLPESHAFSYERSGRYRTEVLRVSDYCTQAELESRARAYLYANCGDATSIVIEHPRIPGVEVGAVVDYRNSVDDPSPVSVRCLVTQQNIRALGPGCMTQSKLLIIGWR